MPSTYPCFYLFVYGKLRERSKNGHIHTADVMDVICWMMPRTARIYRYVIVKELEEFGLIKRLNKRKYVITGGSVDRKLEKYRVSILTPQ